MYTIFRILPLLFLFLPPPPIFCPQVFSLLRSQGHNIVGVFTVPDISGRADPLAEQAQQEGVPVFKYPRWRTKGKPIGSVRL